MLGKRIQDLLNERKISQSELARRVGVRQSTMNMLITGRTQGSKHLHKIARELGTTPAYLLGETDDPHGEGPELSLTSEETKFLEIYRDLDKKDRAAIKRLMQRLITDEESGS